MIEARGVRRRKKCIKGLENYRQCQHEKESEYEEELNLINSGWSKYI